jgi:hypothetical protein
MNITLPNDIVKKLANLPNKSAFIASAIADKFASDKKESRRLQRLAAYKWVAKHPEYEEDARPDW